MLSSSKLTFAKGIELLLLWVIFDGLKEIQGTFFSRNYQIVNIFNTSITEIPNNAMKDMKNLSTIVFPSNLLIIGIRTFENCHSIENIVIPSSLYSIGENAF